MPFFDQVEYAAGWLVRRLNADKRDAHLDQAQLAQLIHDINALDKTAERAGYPTVRRNEASELSSDADVDALNQIRAPSDSPYNRNDVSRLLGRGAKELFCHIDAQMDQVRLSPTLIIPTKRGWIRLWHNTENYYETLGGNALHRQMLDMSVLAVLDLAERGKLKNLRRCDHCGQWYFALKSIQRFCKDGCRSDNHREKPNVKAERAKYMRGYRAKEKRKDAEALRFAQRRSIYRSR